MAGDADSLSDDADDFMIDRSDPSDVVPVTSVVPVRVEPLTSVPGQTSRTLGHGRGPALRPENGRLILPSYRVHHTIPTDFVPTKLL